MVRVSSYFRQCYTINGRYRTSYGVLHVCCTIYSAIYFVLYFVRSGNHFIDCFDECLNEHWTEQAPINTFNNETDQFIIMHCMESKIEVTSWQRGLFAILLWKTPWGFLWRKKLKKWIWILQPTRSNRFFQASSRCAMSSIQCDNVASIPAVVALNVNASPLKSIACAPCCCKMLTEIIET